MNPLAWLVFLVGLCLGSFLNVVIYRLPRGLSLWGPRSFCPACRRKLPWYENLPLLSYIFLRGRCRGCGHPIPLRYPLVEFLSGALAFYFYSRFDLTFSALILYLFTLLLLAATFIDLEHGIIPDPISLGGLILGWCTSPWNPLISPQESLLGALCGAGGFYLLGEFYYWLRGREGLGGGDYKLLAMIGSFLGWQSLLPVVFLGSLSGTLVIIPWLILSRRKLSGDTSLPFGPFLSLGALLFLFFGQTFLMRALPAIN